MQLKTLSLVTLSLLSAHSYAVENGTPIDWNEQDNAVRFGSTNNPDMYCTGTLIAGRYVLTASHCLVKWDKNEDIQTIDFDHIVTASQEETPVNQGSFIKHPDFVMGDYYDEFTGIDVGLVPLDVPVDYKKIQVINAQDLVQDEALQVKGFGGTKDTLNAANFTLDIRNNSYHPYKLYANMVDESHTIGGDSGATWTSNDDNKIIAIHQGSINHVSNDNEKYRETYGTDIRYAREFLLDNIDGWHYPTVAKTENGKATITIQSLHINDVIDTAVPDGDVTLVGDESTCMTKTVIEPFETCTYVIESNGGEGKLSLSDSEVIHINKPTDNTGGDNGNNNSGDDDTGGSVGFWSLLFLGFASLRRKR